MKPAGCEVCGHVKGQQQTGPRSPWRIRAEQAERERDAAMKALGDVIQNRDEWIRRGREFAERVARLRAALVEAHVHFQEAERIARDDWTDEDGAVAFAAYADAIAAELEEAGP